MIMKIIRKKKDKKTFNVITWQLVLWSGRKKTIIYFLKSLSYIEARNKLKETWLLLKTKDLAWNEDGI